MSPRLIIEQLARTKSDGEIEKLEFTEGVNAIVGPQNTGKSTWLRMLDFLMADDGSPNMKFDQALVLKYRAVSALMRLSDTTVELERTWSSSTVLGFTKDSAAPLSAGEYLRV
jgi:ABC-type enterochelin transport system ATPase subunit